MVYPYPSVLDEFQTIAACASGKSIARIGDGELKVMLGSHAAREVANKDLARELLDCVCDPHPSLLPAIPTMDESGPKWAGWKKHIVNFCRVLEPGVQYGSAFISRPDSAGTKIETYEFCDSIRRLWTGKRVVLVSELDVAIYNVVTTQPFGPSHFTHIECPHEGTYAQIGTLHKHILRAAPDFVLLSCGPAATALAHRLCKNGVHTLDIGSAGRFLARNLWPKQPQEK